MSCCKSARKCGKTIGGASVVDESMLAMALHLCDDKEMSLRDIVKRLVITTGRTVYFTPAGGGVSTADASLLSAASTAERPHITHPGRPQRRSAKRRS
jgi:hypothetical protein